MKTQVSLSPLVLKQICQTRAAYQSLPWVIPWVLPAMIIHGISRWVYPLSSCWQIPSICECGTG